MDKRKKYRSKKSEQTKQLQNIAQLVSENQELENKYKLVSAELDLLKNHMQNLNHDLRSPLGGITGMIDLMISEDKDQTEVQTSDLIMIKESAKSLLDLINDTLTVRGTHESQKETMNIGRMLTSVIIEINRLYLPMAKNKGISLSLRNQIDTEIQLPPNFFNNLIQILGNLVANAIKFTPSNGSVDMDFTMDADENNNLLKMSVIDSGKSMSPDQIKAFNQGKPVARSMGTNGEQGFGIGLQHVLQMVSEDDGRIFAKRRKGSGTAFMLSFPLPDKKLNRMNAFFSLVKNESAILNGNGNGNGIST